MPSASDELRAEMGRRFGDEIDDQGPMKYLADAGYVLRQDWHYTAKPGVSSLADMTRPEFDCLLFLAHEWDFGGLVDAEGRELR